MVEGMSLGVTPRQPDMFTTTTSFCEGRVAPDSIYGLLHRESHRLFADESFADLFTNVGRRSVPPTIVAVVMVLQRIEGCSDREAVDRFTFDARWKYAAGGLDFDHPGFVHTVLVDMRARLAASERPERIFEAVLQVANDAGLVGRKRVLDSTCLYDAVATMDTVTLLRAGVRGLLGACAKDLTDELRGLLRRDDDYATAGKPVCDYEDEAAREALVDALAKDAGALLGALDGRELTDAVSQAAVLLATLAGQDLDEDPDGVFRIARRVAKDRVISTVDPEARHGRKTSARGFDGYKGHVAVDPDSELITATVVTAGNVGDAAPAAGLLDGELPGPAASDPASTDNGDGDGKVAAPADAAPDSRSEPLAVFGDAAYGAGALLAELEAVDAEIFCKVQPAASRDGRFSKDAFEIDLQTGTVRCPADHTVALREVKDGQIARFANACAGCPLAAQCTTSQAGRTIHVGPHQAQLARARQAQAVPAWKQQYTSTRPKVERKIGHLMHRKHGGRRARVRGTTKIAADFKLLAAAVNLKRLAKLGLAHHQAGGWQTATP